MRRRVTILSCCGDRAKFVERVYGTGAVMRVGLSAGLGLVALLVPLFGGAKAADMAVKAPPQTASACSDYDWTGFYVGGHLGYGWGKSSFSDPGVGIAGSLDLFQPFDAFKSTGSFFEGLQVGYDYVLPNRVLVGVEADASFPSFPSAAGVSIGG